MPSNLFVKAFLRKRKLFSSLLLFAGGMGFSFFLYQTMTSSEQEETIEACVPLLKNASEKNQLVAPEFKTVDEKGQPYTIKADFATTQPETNAIELQKPSYEIFLNQPNGPLPIDVKIQSKRGIFDQTQKTLQLFGGVFAHYGTRATFTMPSIDIDLEKGSAKGNESIQIIHDNMMIEAGAFEIYHKGEKVILKDHPVLTLTFPSNDSKQNQGTKHP